MNRPSHPRPRDPGITLGAARTALRRHAGVRALGWLMIAILPSVVLAQSAGGSYRIRKQAIAAGVVATGANYRLVGTVGQAVAGPQGTGTYRVSGGFHFAQGAGTSAPRLFCDGFEDGPCP